MPKRKRDGNEDDNSDKSIVDRTTPGQVYRLKATIEQSNKTLMDALKLAKGFEKQKLGRRQKSAANEPHVLLRLREEVIFLKQLDLNNAAQNHLLKQLIKTKRIKQSPVFIKIYGDNPSTDNVKQGAEANVIGRLFNSTPVKQALPGIMSNIFEVLQLQEKPVVKESRNPEESIAVVEDGPQSVEETTSPISSSRSPSNEPTSSKKILQESNTRTGDSISENTTSSDNESLPINSSEDGDGELLRPTSISKTAFLPSLNMGGYYSGSESDDASQDYGAADAAGHATRKNRRGQRARQQLAELKYGKNAKHLQPQTRTSNRNAGWDPRRGAVEHKSQHRETFGRPRSTKQNSETVDGVQLSRQGTRKDGKGKEDAAKLHPSWEAAKFKKQQSINQNTFSGKKITFE